MFSKGITHWTLLKGLRQCFLGKFHAFIDKYERNHSKNDEKVGRYLCYIRTLGFSLKLMDVWGLMNEPGGWGVGWGHP